MSDENKKPKMVRGSYRKPPQHGHKLSKRAAERRSRRRDRRKEDAGGAPEVATPTEKPAVVSALKRSREGRLRAITTEKGKLTRRENELREELAVIETRRGELNTERDKIRAKLGKSKLPS